MAEEFDTRPSLVKSIMKSNSVIDIITHIRYISANGVTAKAAGIRRLVER
jgi:hypothetical protein